MRNADATYLRTGCRCQNLRRNDVCQTRSRWCSLAEIAKDVCPTLNCNHEAPIATYDMRGNGAADDLSPTLRSMGGERPNGGGQMEVAIGIDEEQNAHVELMGCLKAREKGGGFEGSVMTHSQVRRLTPVECERLQGLPDKWTKIPCRIFQEANRKGVSYESILLARGKHLAGPAIDECPDGPRYKGIGNGQTVPVMLWLAKRIMSEIKK